jgi:hypothetical protein
MTRILIVILLGLACCTGDKKQTSNKVANSTVNNDFMKFVSLLPKLKLPFETNCEKCCSHPRMDYDTALIERFRPKGSAIVGLIEKTDDRVIILVTYPGDVLVPSVKVYDREGKLTGQMDFMTSYCGGDFEYYGRQFFRITSDLSFSNIDTSYYLKMDTVDYHVIDTTKIEITKKDFSINDKGEVVENNAHNRRQGV